MKTFFGLLLSLFLTQAIVAQTTALPAAGECPVAYDKTWGEIWDVYLETLERLPDSDLKAKKAIQCVSELSPRIDINKFGRLYKIIQLGNNPPWARVQLLENYLNSRTSLYDQDLQDLASLMEIELEGLAAENLLSGKETIQYDGVLRGDYISILDAVSSRLEKSFVDLKNEYESGNIDQANAHYWRLKDFEKRMQQHYRSTLAAINRHEEMFLFQTKLAESLTKWMHEADVAKTGAEIKILETKRKAEEAKREAELEKSVKELDSLLQQLKAIAKCPISSPVRNPNESSPLRY